MKYKKSLIVCGAVLMGMQLQSAQRIISFARSIPVVPQKPFCLQAHNVLKHQDEVLAYFQKRKAAITRRGYAAVTRCQRLGMDRDYWINEGGYLSAKHARSLFAKQKKAKKSSEVWTSIEQVYDESIRRVLQGTV